MSDEQWTAAKADEVVSLEAQLRALSEETAARAKATARLAKALAQLGRPAVLEAPPKVARLLKELEALAELPESAIGEGVPARLSALGSAVRADQATRLAARRVTFGRDMTAAASGEGILCRVLAADPLELDLLPFTVLVDPEAGKASLCYARLEVASVGADPGRILKERGRRLKALDAGWGAEAFFAALLAAYREELRGRALSGPALPGPALSGRALPEGERVPLVSLLGRLAFAFQPKQFLRDPVATRFRDYGRPQLAWDLARLRREGKLAQGGLRCSLGPATMEAAKRKEDVLYLEDGPGRGQYYATLWFVAEERPAQAEP